MSKPQIGVIVGSNRSQSSNRKLAEALIKLGAARFSAYFVRTDDLPMFNPDLEAAMPAQALRLKADIARADGIIIVTPEYDRSIPPVLKNAIDWAARPYGANSWNGKPGFITGGSPGPLGTALAQQHLRSVMAALGMTLLGGEAYITFKPNLIDDQGQIGDDGTRKLLADAVERFATLVERLPPQAAARSAA